MKTATRMPKEGASHKVRRQNHEEVIPMASLRAASSYEPEPVTASNTEGFEGAEEKSASRRNEDDFNDF